MLSLLLTLTLASLAFEHVLGMGLSSPIHRSLFSRSSNINNCSGTVPPNQLGYAASSYGPQISGEHGWETWTFYVAAPDESNNSFSVTVLQWARGDPASASSNLSEGTFSASFVAAGVEFKSNITDKFVYEKSDHSHFSISIGGNRISYDATLGPFGGWNISVDISGLKADHFIDPVAPNVLYEPTYHDVPSQLVEGFFTNFPVPRGHVDGVMTYPSGFVCQVRSVGIIKHAFAKEPMQHLVSSFIRGTIFAAPYQQVNWLQAQGIGSHKLVNTAQLVTGDMSTAEDLTLKYQVTDDPIHLKIFRSEYNTTVVLSGCNESQQNPYVFSTKAYTYGGAVFDSAGGKMETFITVSDVWIWTSDNQLYAGNNTLGHYEVYFPPPVTSSN